MFIKKLASLLFPTPVTRDTNLSIKYAKALVREEPSVGQILNKHELTILAASWLGKNNKLETINNPVDIKKCEYNYNLINQFYKDKFLGLIPKLLPLSLWCTLNGIKGLQQ